LADFVNNCLFNPTLGGTTDWVVSTAVSGYMTPTAAGMVNGRVYKYRAESSSLLEWEYGEGVWNSGAGALARTTVFQNSLGTTAKINFSTAPFVGIVHGREDTLLIDAANAFTAAQQLQARDNLSAYIGRALGGTADLNTLVSPGTWYTVDAASTNVPPLPAASYWFIYVNVYSSTNYVQQIATLLETGTYGISWQRIRNGGTWGPWYRIAINAPSNKNYLVNPSGEINQFGVGSQTDVTYDFDQWVVLTQTAAVTASSISVPLGTAMEDGTPYAMRLLQAQATAQRFGRIQWLEHAESNGFRNQPATLTARVRMSAATTLRYAIIAWTGTPDSITKDVVLSWTNTTFTAGNFFTSTSTVIVATGSIALAANTPTDITPITGVVTNAGNNLAVFFWTDSAQAQNVTLDIAKVKLEMDRAPTAFEAPNAAAELLRCQRFFQLVHPHFYIGAAAGANVYQTQSGPMLATMRGTPSTAITVTANTNFNTVVLGALGPQGWWGYTYSLAAGYCEWSGYAWLSARL
jgi:hypothetical protein